MAYFINDVLTDLLNKSVEISHITFVLPSKRAGLFLKNELSKLSPKTRFAPTILSIEEFIEDLSQLKQISNTELLFKFYSVYLELTNKEDIEPFDSFSKWAQIILQDFNEIDRFLISQDKIFDYLSAIKEIDHWSLEQNQTPLIKNHLAFWKKLSNYYNNLYDELINNGVGYQGLIYREAVENLQSYILENKNKQHVFLGFNALNKAESNIIQELLQNDLARIYWDIDETFINNNKHEAGRFIRQHKTNWNFFNSNPFQWITNEYSDKKNITVVGVPKNVGQAKYIGELLMGLTTNSASFNKTAVILGNENLLIPIIHSLPDQIENLNITMGFPLKSIPMVSLFNQLFLMHKDNKSSFYFKDVVALLSHQNIRPLFQIENDDVASIIINEIQTNNLIFISKEKLIKLGSSKKELIELLFRSWNNSPKRALEQCIDLIFFIKNNLDRGKTAANLSLEYLYKINNIFNSLNELNSKYNYIDSIPTCYALFKELLQNETIDIKGEPLKGLQIMGMLESRVLDYETVIISSVNEGILPSGKTNNSFIPFEVKLENGLPTYKEKDAVYTYHFYRLLQRAKNVYLIYNTEPDVVNGGEKSRFITQLEIEGVHSLEQVIVSPAVPKITTKPKRISKTYAVMQQIEALGHDGLSPSSLTQYIRNPMDFYYQKVLGIKENDDVEESIAANTLGTVIHESLKDLYSPLVNKFLSVKDLKYMSSQISSVVTSNFIKVYKEGEINRGKNLIIFEIAKRYVSNFLENEIKGLNKGNKIKILHVESNVETQINLPELRLPIKLKGQIDRVDEFNGKIRVIDYKTGKVEQGKVEIVNWDDITTDYDNYSKSFQLLCYAYILNCNKSFFEPIEAGIVSFKNLRKGLLKFGKKESLRSRIKDNDITEETLNKFFIELKKLILEIYDKDIDFIEKKI